MKAALLATDLCPSFLSSQNALDGTFRRTRHYSAGPHDLKMKLER